SVRSTAAPPSTRPGRLVGRVQPASCHRARGRRITVAQGLRRQLLDLVVPRIVTAAGGTPGWSDGPRHLGVHPSSSAADSELVAGGRVAGCRRSWEGPAAAPLEAISFIRWVFLHVCLAARTNRTTRRGCNRAGCQCCAWPW